MTSFDVKRRCLMLKDEIWRHLTSNDVDLLWLKVIFNHFSSKIIDGFFWKIKNVKNRHKSSTQVIIRREQRFSSKFIMNDASCQMTSYDVKWRHPTPKKHEKHHSSSFHIRQIWRLFSSIFMIRRHSTSFYFFLHNVPNTKKNLN